MKKEKALIGHLSDNHRGFFAVALTFLLVSCSGVVTEKNGWFYLYKDPGDELINPVTDVHFALKARQGKSKDPVLWFSSSPTLSSRLKDGHLSLQNDPEEKMVLEIRQFYLSSEERYSDFWRYIRSTSFFSGDSTTLEGIKEETIISSTFPLSAFSNTEEMDNRYSNFEWLLPRNSEDQEGLYFYLSLYFLKSSEPLKVDDGSRTQTLSYIRSDEVGISFRWQGEEAWIEPYEGKYGRTVVKEVSE